MIGKEIDKVLKASLHNRECIMDTTTRDLYIGAPDKASNLRFNTSKNSVVLICPALSEKEIFKDLI